LSRRLFERRKKGPGTYVVKREHDPKRIINYARRKQAYSKKPLTEGIKDERGFNGESSGHLQAKGGVPSGPTQ